MIKWNFENHLVKHENKHVYDFPFMRANQVKVVSQI